jgi:hypothetical protein
VISNGETPSKGSRLGPRKVGHGKCSLETQGIQNGTRIMVGWLTQGVRRMLRLGQGSARAYSPSAQACSPSAQVKAAAAHIQSLKRNQRKKKVILSLWVFTKISVWDGAHVSGLGTCTVGKNRPGNRGLSITRPSEVSFRESRYERDCIGHKASQVHNAFVTSTVPGLSG